MKAPVFFSAINKRIETFTEAPTEAVSRGASSYVRWGERNTYPNYLYEVFQGCTTLNTVINGVVDYVCGDGVESAFKTLNRKKETPEDIIRKIARSIAIYNGVALQVIRNYAGEVAEVYVLDLRNVRTDADGEKIFYSEKWNNSRVDVITYPKYVADFKEATSVLFDRDTDYTVYPAPLYLASIKACEIERAIDDFHINSINNGFMGSYIINFNNGDVTEEEQDEIEKNINEKFGGACNAGRMMLTFNDSQDTAPTIQKLEIDDFGDKYETLAKHCRQQIFTSFRANPNIFGIPTENLGFSNEEYESAFKLFNRTQIKPIQARIIRILERIYGEGQFYIKPFTMGESITNVQ
jgi:hypothetical protein